MSEPTTVAGVSVVAGVASASEPLSEKAATSARASMALALAPPREFEQVHAQFEVAACDQRADCGGSGRGKRLCSAEREGRDLRSRLDGVGLVAKVEGAAGDTDFELLRRVVRTRVAVVARQRNLEPHHRLGVQPCHKGRCAGVGLRYARPPAAQPLACGERGRVEAGD